MNVQLVLNFNFLGSLVKAIKYMLIILALFANSSANACKPGGLEKFIEFEKEDATIGVSRAKIIALWFIDWRDIDGISSVLVHADYNEDNNASQNISNERLNNVAKLLAPLVAQKVKIKYVNSPKKSDEKVVDDYYFNTVGISIQPKCIETQSCCGGNMH